MAKCVYAGSFDPITNGHLSIIQDGADLFDELVVAIGINPDKRYTFSLEERMELLRESTKHINNVSLDSFENQFLVNYARSIGAGFILRGLRNITDYEYERAMNNVNRDLNQDITTFLLMAPRKLCEVSSSFVKGLVGPEGWEDVVKNYVPEIVFQKLVEKYRR